MRLLLLILAAGLTLTACETPEQIAAFEAEQDNAWCASHGIVPSDPLYPACRQTAMQERRYYEAWQSQR
jgi:hypothetical protein